jgi:hypothetical protein
LKRVNVRHARALRLIAANECYHVINRGNQKARLFHSALTTQHSCDYMRDARSPGTAGACRMPHAESRTLVVRPRTDGDMRLGSVWLFTPTFGDITANMERPATLAGAYKACLIQQDHTADRLRYVERNALAARLVHEPKIGVGQPELAHIGLRTTRADCNTHRLAKMVD